MRNRRVLRLAPLVVVGLAIILPAGGLAVTSVTALAATASSGDIGSSGGHLVLDGQDYRFVGVNAYELATDWGTNSGCGAMVSGGQLNDFFASLRPNSLVRMWAFQGSMATNVTTHELDWGPLDRVFSAAAAHGQRLIVSLTDQSGTCDNGHWQDPAWYDGGFMNVINAPSNTDGLGLTRLSYWDYLQAIVTHFRSSPALGMWEPISEPEASTCPVQYEPRDCSGHQTCPDEAVAARALRHFFDVVGAEIHALDPNHLVEDGMLGGGECGTAGPEYEFVSGSPGIDVLSYHDYYAGPTLMGGDEWNGLDMRLEQASLLNKPIIAGEMGMEAGAGCASLWTRTKEVTARVQAQMAAGSSGVLLWDWVPELTSSCAFDVAPGDPVLNALASYPLSP
jgi:mannan endo-1,4-beta-mannosidase